jgi:LysM repeat protein
VSGGGTTTTNGEPAPGPPFSPGDDRLNSDPAAPVAIYCRPDGIHVFAIDRFGQGRELFVATFNEINAVGIPSVNTLIDSVAGVGLHRLTSGEFQLNSSRASSTQPKVRAQEAGQTIIHTVQPGENLFRIAIRYNTTVAAIAQLNGITDPSRIFAGQQLTIVVGSRGAAGTPVTVPGTNVVNQPSSVGIGAGYVFIFGGC